MPIDDNFFLLRFNIILTILFCTSLLCILHFFIFHLISSEPTTRPRSRSLKSNSIYETKFETNALSFLVSVQIYQSLFVTVVGWNRVTRVVLRTILVPLLCLWWKHLLLSLQGFHCLCVVLVLICEKQYAFAELSSSSMQTVTTLCVKFYWYSTQFRNHSLIILTFLCRHIILLRSVDISQNILTVLPCPYSECVHFWFPSVADRSLE